MSKQQPVLEEPQEDGYIRQLYEVEGDPEHGEWKYKDIKTGKILTHQQYMEQQNDNQDKKKERQTKIYGSQSSNR